MQMLEKLLVGAALGAGVYYVRSTGAGVSASEYGLGPAWDRKNWANIAKLAPIKVDPKTKKRTVDPLMSRLLENANVRAFLMVIRAGESSMEEKAYLMVYGGGLVSSIADHPRQSFKIGSKPLRRCTAADNAGTCTSAAGAYQFLAKSWDDTAKELGLSGFYPGNQDMGAVGQIAFKGALRYLLDGRLKMAISKINEASGWNVWTSLPGGDEQRLTYEKARKVFIQNGGSLADGN